MARSYHQALRDYATHPFPESLVTTCKIAAAILQADRGRFAAFWKSGRVDLALAGLVVPDTALEARGGRRASAGQAA